MLIMGVVFWILRWVWEWGVGGTEIYVIFKVISLKIKTNFRQKWGNTKVDFSEIKSFCPAKDKREREKVTGLQKNMQMHLFDKRLLLKSTKKKTLKLNNRKIT